MRKIIALTLIVMIVIVSGCGSSDQLQPQKQSLEIQTLPLHTDDNTGYLTKNAKVQWTSEITITSQVAGKIQSLPKNIGDAIVAGTLIAKIQDTASAGGPWSNTLREANLALQRAQTTEMITRSDIEQQKRQLEYDLENLDAGLDWSTTQLQLSQMENQLVQAELDYKNSQRTSTQSNAQFIDSMGDIRNNLLILLGDVVNESDKFLWQTDDYDDYMAYTHMRQYLFGSNRELANEAKDMFWILYKNFDELKSIETTDINEDNVDERIYTFKTMLTNLSNHFALMQEVFTYLTVIEDYSIRNEVQTAKGVVTWLQWRFSQLQATSLQQLNSMQSYFSSYDDNQELMKRQIDNLKTQIALTKKQLDDANFSATIGGTRSELGFQNQLKNAEISTQSARLSVEQANLYASKFSITSPIQASVADILVDVGQDISPGTPIATIVSQQQQIETSFSLDQIKHLHIWQKVQIESELGSAQWEVAQISEVADDTGSFKVIVVLQESTIPTGMFVTLQFPIQNWSLVLPLNALTIVDTNKALAYFRDSRNQTLVNQIVTIQSIFAHQVEISDTVDMNYELVVSDLSRYDERTMQLVPPTL